MGDELDGVNQSVPENLDVLMYIVLSHSLQLLYGYECYRRIRVGEWLTNVRILWVCITTYTYDFHELNNQTSETISTKFNDVIGECFHTEWDKHH